MFVVPLLDYIYPWSVRKVGRLVNEVLVLVYDGALVWVRCDLNCDNLELSHHRKSHAVKHCVKQVR